MVTRYDSVKDLYQTVDLFSSESFTAWDPHPPYRFVPTQIDPPEHIKYRQLLNPKFSPGAVTRAEEPSREIARRMIAEIATTGRVRLRQRLRHPLPHRSVPCRHRAAAGGLGAARAMGGGLLPRSERRRGGPGRDGRLPGGNPRLLRRRPRRPAGEPARPVDRPRRPPARLDGRRRAAQRRWSCWTCAPSWCSPGSTRPAGSSATCSSSSPSGPTSANRSSTIRR